MVTVNTYNVELRDKDGNLRQYLTPWVKTLSWEWNRIGGCGRCRIKLVMAYRKLDFSAGDDIQIRIKSGLTSKLVYRGWVAGTVPSLKIGQEITLDVRGYFDRLAFLVVHSSGDTKTYTNTLVSAIVDDIVDTFITPNTSITKGTIDAANFTADTISFKTKVLEALRTLGELEGRVEYGVDENLVFFWRAESDTLNRKFFVGNNIQMLERRVNWNRLLNKIYFEGGEISGSPFIKNAEVGDSQTMYFLAEGIITNTSITTSSVADQYLSAILRERSSPQLTVRIKIPNTDLRLEDTIPMGQVAVFDAQYDNTLFKWGKTASGGDNKIWGRLTSGGDNLIWGSVYKAQIDRISYNLADTDERFNIEVTLGSSILETAAKLKQIELDLSNIRQGR